MHQRGFEVDECSITLLGTNSTYLRICAGTFPKREVTSDSVRLHFGCGCELATAVMWLTKPSWKVVGMDLVGGVDTVLWDQPNQP